jgi:hypothetical protein
MLLGIASLWALTLVRKAHDSGLRVQIAINAAICLNLLLFVVTNAAPLPARLLLVTILLGYLTLGVARLLLATTSLPPARAVVVPIILLAPLFALETFWGATMPAARPRTGDVRPQPPLPDTSGVYAPGSTAEMVFSDNPRRYFALPGAYRPEWSLYAHDSLHAGQLFRSDTAPDLLRVHVDRVGGIDYWRLQLQHMNVRVNAGRNYRLTFRARSNRPRVVGYQLYGSREGQRDLGLGYRTSRVDTAWRTWSEEFRASGNDAEAKLLVDVAQDTGTIEFSTASITDLSTGLRVRPMEETRFLVSYRFNNVGCRGPDVPLTRPPGVVRVLSLGDGRTLGVGVHEQDTYAAHLERLLNDPTAVAANRLRYEVLNCGVAGYGLGDALKLYDRLHQRVGADVVVLAVAPGDDQPFGAFLHLANSRDYGSLDYLSASVFRLRRWREARREAPQNLNRVITQVTALRDSVRKDTARLALLVFDDLTSLRGRQLDSALTASFQRTDVTVVSVGEALRPFAARDRVVHPLLDAHPNDVAHGVAGRSLHRELRERGVFANAEERRRVAAPRDSTRRGRGAAPPRR